MREIPLTRGYVAQVSDEDYERISKFNWYANVNPHHVRAMRNDGPYRKYMHHEVMQTTMHGDQEVDHIDRNPLNNQRDNLRIVTRVQNMRNTKRHLQRVGVCFNKRANLWIAYLDNPDCKRKYLGYRKTREEALALVEAARCG